MLTRGFLIAFASTMWYIVGGLIAVVLFYGAYSLLQVWFYRQTKMYLTAKEKKAAEEYVKNYIG